jgi:hypothetical protein
VSCHRGRDPHQLPSGFQPIPFENAPARFSAKSELSFDWPAYSIDEVLQQLRHTFLTERYLTYTATLGACCFSSKRLAEDLQEEWT